jgi:hypothetical protein
MMRAAAGWFLVAMLAAASAPPAAAPIYRCGPDGRLYTQTPCPEGRLIQAADPRSEAQRVEAQRVAARERKVAAQLERDRRAQAAAPITPAAGIENAPPPAAGPAPKPQPPKKHPRHKARSGAAATDDFVAVEPGGRRKSRAR